MSRPSYEEVLKRLARVVAYDVELQRLELPPNGDDYNAVHQLLLGGELLLPEKEGR
jgi:hypothetical protein